MTNGHSLFSYLSLRRHQAFTLVEVMVAIFIMAVIGAMTGQAFQSATSSSEATEEAVARINAVDRFWFLLEQDLRRAVPKVYTDRYGSSIPAFFVNEDEETWLTLMRTDMENLSTKPRMDIARVGYRLQEGSLWRDIWYHPRKTEVEDARSRRLVDEVKFITVRVLMPNATSLSAGPWQSEWGMKHKRNEHNQLPRGIEVTVEFEDFGEIKRLYALLPGATGS